MREKVFLLGGGGGGLRIQFCGLLQRLWRDENVVKEAHCDCERERGRWVRFCHGRSTEKPNSAQEILSFPAQALMKMFQQLFIYLFIGLLN